MHRSDPPLLPPDLAAALDALPDEERRALEATWTCAEPPEVPAPDAARKAATWAALQRTLARSRPPTRLSRPSHRRSANAPQWRAYTLGFAASLLVLLALGWWALPSSGTFSATDTARTLHLSDGTEVTLAPHSVLHLSDAWPEVRSVTLDGTAHFEVAHDAAHPFAVETDQATVTVLGTVFTVYARASEATRVQVASGRVAVEHAAKRVEITADEQAIARADAPLAVRPVPSSPAAVFAFEDAPAHVLFDEIEVLFGLAVTYPEPVGRARLTLTRHGPLEAEALVQAICAALDLRYRRTARGFALSPR